MRWQDLEQENEILYDFREMIVKQACSNEKHVWKGEKGREHWSNWNRWNILQKTFEYELEKSLTHIEKDENVKENAFSSYCINYAEVYRTADIMNGWWNCFKELLDFKSRGGGDDLERLGRLLNESQNNVNLVELLKGELKDDYVKDGDEICKALLRFLKVVYTTGNMTPAPINPSTGRYGLDNWEYKLNTYKGMYHDYKGVKEKLLFQDYYEKDEIKISPKREDFQKNPAGYMNERVELILKRGCRIVGISEAEWEGLFNSLLAENEKREVPTKNIAETFQL